MSVLIMGLKMQKEETLKIAIRDGTASVYLDEGKADYYSVIELPDHGDLVDRDVVERLAVEIWMRNSNGDDAMQELIHKLREEVPVVIPAERSEK